MAESSHSSVLQLAEHLSAGFLALSGEYQLLFDQQRQLENRLACAKQQYLDLLKRFSPETVSQDHKAFLHELEHAVADPSQTPSAWVENIERSDDADRRDRAALIKRAETASEHLHIHAADNGVKIWSGPSADKDRPALRIQPNVELSALEKDFTTAGTPSRLGCPFATNGAQHSPLVTPRSSTSRMSFKGRRSKRPSFNDPIRAEICGNDLVSTSASASADGSAAVCPIRFLDQHAPEEVAKYFEKHKHELPRSHEVCINRFQSNAESIRQLDRKYGNLVSMIQGLGEKHQAWLPEEPEEEEDADVNAADAEAKADVTVEKWATAVSASLHDCTPGEEETPDQTIDEARTAHFDRPMKEIRVGESPSRPWGISIPPKYTDAESSSSVGSAPTASPPLPLDMSRPIGETPKKVGQCPFGHVAQENTANLHAQGSALPQVSTLERPTEPDPDPEPEPQILPESKRTEEKISGEQHTRMEPPKIIPQMVFNGPVFLGYPPDQLVILLQNSNLGAALR